MTKPMFQCTEHETGALDCSLCYLEAQCNKGIKDAIDATEHAMEYQDWASEQNLSYSELSEYQAYFLNLATQFDLVEEFSENGII